MEFTLAELATIATMVGAVSLMWHRVSKARADVASWRSATDLRIDRLEENKERLFDKLDRIEGKLDQHMMDCTKDKTSIEQAVRSLEQAVLQPRE